MTPSRAVARLSDFVLDQFAPRRCPGCDRELGGRGTFCAPCECDLGAPIALSFPPHPTNGGAGLVVRALGAYRHPLSSAIRRIKYESRSDLVAPLANAWLQAHPEARRVHADRLVPVPLHPRKLASRGFNQSALVAQQLARGLSIPRSPRLLEKVIETPSQASLGLQGRRTNLIDAFSTDPRRARPGQKLVLIDDVVTTGETARACIRALAAAQLRVVEIWALSHTPLDSHP